MKKLFSLLLIASLFACGDGSDDNDDLKTTEGHEQLQTPVENSGTETEKDRALESIGQDTTGKQIIIGKDSAQ
ncbi:MAG: hypothetical protein ACXWV5_03070 [Flavitalea sp.]